MREKISNWYSRYGFIIPFCFLAWALHNFHVQWWLIAVVIFVGIVTNIGSLFSGEAKGIRETSKAWHDMFDHYVETEAQE